jgi:hypothetical protein
MGQAALIFLPFKHMMLFCLVVYQSGLAHGILALLVWRWGRLLTSVSFLLGFQKGAGRPTWQHFVMGKVPMFLSIALHLPWMRMQMLCVFFYTPCLKVLPGCYFGIVQCHFNP